MSAPASSQDASSQNESTDRKNTSEGESLDGQAAKTDTDSVECPSCGRTFSGTYCPDCGEEVGRSLTVGDVAGDVFREVSEIGSGLPATMVGFTVRPGEVLQEYLSGARKQYMSPGRYLVAAVILFLGVAQGLTWLGLQKSLADSAMMAGQPSGLAEEVAQLTRSQWFTLVAVFTKAGILGLLFWRIFGEKLRRGAEALAVGAFLIAHGSVLSVGVKILLVPLAFLWGGDAVDPLIPVGLDNSIPVVYTGVATYCAFGKSWKSAFKGVLGSMWAQIETVGIVSIPVLWYVFLSSPSLRSAGGDGGTALVVAGGLTIVYLLPLLLHTGMEVYYRLC